MVADVENHHFATIILKTYSRKNNKWMLNQEEENPDKE